MRLRVIPALTAVLVLAAACTSPQGDDTSTGGFGTGGSGGDLKIGVVGAFSGPVSYVGNAVLNGVNYAKDVLNEKGGILGRKVVVVKCDGQFSPSTEVNCLTKLSSVDNVDLIITDDSQGVETLGPAKTAALKVPVMFPVAAPAKIDVKETPNLFSLGATGTDPAAPEGDIAVLSKFLVQDKGYKRFAVIQMDVGPFATATKVFQQFLGEYGGQVVTLQKFQIGDVDMSSQVRAAQSAGAQVVICLGLGADCARVAQAMQRFGYKAQLAGTATFYMRAFRELAKGATNDAVFTVPRSDSIDPAFLQWLFEYFRRYGVKTFLINGSKSPDYPGLELPAYCAVDVYAKAARVARSTEAAKVIKALERPRGYKCVATLRTWTATDHTAKIEPPGEPWITRFKNGHLMWDWDPRGVPPLEDARYAVEEEALTAGYKTDADAVIGIAGAYLAELEKREAEIVPRIGQEEFDKQVSDLKRAIQAAKSLKKSGKARKLPEIE